MGRNVLVTGGAGFIGSHLVDALVSRGDRVVVVDNLSTGQRGNLPPGVDLVVAGAEDASALEPLMRGVELVYHLAALASVQASLDNPLASHAACATATVTVCQAARLAGVRRVVYAGSASAYGIPAGPVQHESDPLSPLSPYAAAKLAGELYLQAFGASFGLETARLRFFNVFGPRQQPDSPYSGVIALFASALMRGRQPIVLGDGLQTRDFVYVSDVVRALLAAGESRAMVGQVVQVGTGKPTTLLELIAALGVVLDKPVQPGFGPARSGDIRHSCANLDQARALLGYSPSVSLSEGLANTLSWMEQTAKTT
ncbi:MAG: NAD-dependent epimerase/dehydratase family protein [Planctomycetota bacterium]|nr:NAD-dependent epimerase/dehydratase family protein [Planctomycetota bacterium]